MFSFDPWRKVRANFDESAIRSFLEKAASESEAVFKAGMTGGHSGVKYPNLPNRSSAPGEYPANQFGPLMASIDTEVEAREFTIGSNVFYSIFLREGTSKMRRRKMSDNAMQEGTERARSMLRDWMGWKVG